MLVFVEILINVEIYKFVWYLGNELGIVYKEWKSVMVCWVLIYFEVYELGVFNLGYILFYNIINV